MIKKDQNQGGEESVSELTRTTYDMDLDQFESFCCGLNFRKVSADRV